MPRGDRVVRQSLHEQFIRKVLIPEDKDDCWVWQGLMNQGGYGRFADFTAHRYSYELFRGIIGKDLCVCHQCDNPKCVNPSHLWLGTNQENTADRNRKGRQAKQHRIRPSLSVEDAIALRNLLLCGVSQKKAAAKFGVSSAMACLILHRKSWHFRDFEDQKMY